MDAHCSVLFHNRRYLENGKDRIHALELAWYDFPDRALEESLSILTQY